MKEITKDMMIYQILDINPQLEDVFIAHGMNCVGCPGSNAETYKMRQKVTVLICAGSWRT